MEMILGTLNRWLRAFIAFFYSSQGEVARLPYSLWFVTYSSIVIAALTFLLLFLISVCVSLFFCLFAACDPSQIIHKLIEWWVGVPLAGISSQEVILALGFLSALLPSVVLVPLKRLRSMGFSAWWFALWLTPVLGIIFGLLLCFWPPKKDFSANHGPTG